MKFNPWTGKLDFEGDGDTIISGNSDVITSNETCGENISALKCVYKDSGVIGKSSSDTLNKSYVFGISKQSGITGSQVNIVQFGILEDPFFNYAQGTLLFCDSNGSITDTCPSTGFRTKIGFSTGIGEIMVSIEEPIEL